MGNHIFEGQILTNHLGIGRVVIACIFPQSTKIIATHVSKVTLALQEIEHLCNNAAQKLENLRSIHLSQINCLSQRRTTSANMFGNPAKNIKNNLASFLLAAVL